MSSSKLIFHSRLLNPLKLKCQQQQLQRFSAAIAETKLQQSHNKMKAWQIHSYGGLDELQLTDSARVPVIDSSDRVLVKVSASSVNPLDVGMTGMSILNSCSSVLLVVLYFDRCRILMTSHWHPSSFIYRLRSLLFQMLLYGTMRKQAKHPSYGIVLLSRMSRWDAPRASVPSGHPGEIQC